MAEKDYYQILGVSRDATQEQIKKAYRKKALELHPDKHQGDKEIEEKFKEVTNAYDVLSNQEKRAAYDRFGDAGVKGGGYSQSTMDDINDILRNFGVNFGGGQQQTYQKRGDDLRVRMKFSLQEIAQGVRRKVKINHYVACQDCSGNGSEKGRSYSTCSQCHGTGVNKNSQSSSFMQIFFNTTCEKCQGEGKEISRYCSTCHGQGRLKIQEVVTISLPAGARDGMAFSMPYKGNAPVRGGISGDLHIIVKEEPDERFYRDKDDHIHYHCYISYPDAVLGTQIDVPGVNGTIKLTVPPHTQSETVLRLRNKGIPNIHTGRPGDQLVHLHIAVPKKLSKEEKNYIKKMKEYNVFTT